MTRIGPRPWERVRARSFGRHERNSEIQRQRCLGRAPMCKEKEKRFSKGEAAPKGFALIRWKFVRKSHGLWSLYAFISTFYKRVRSSLSLLGSSTLPLLPSLRAVFLHKSQDGLLELDYWSIPDSGVLSSRTSFILFYPISLSSRRMRKVGLKTPFESFSPSPGLDPVVHTPKFQRCKLQRGVLAKEASLTTSCGKTWCTC